MIALRSVSKMGARQSVAQPPRQRTTPSSNADSGPSTSGNSNGASSASPHFTNGHSLGAPSTSTSAEARNRSSLIFQSSLASSSSQPQPVAPRPRQTRSRSVPMPPPDMVRGSSSAASSSTNQSAQLPPQYRFHPYTTVARDQSSDSSGGDNDGTNLVTAGLERYLRLSSVAAGGHASTSATGQGTTTVWVPVATSRHYVFADIKCPVCNKVIPSDNVELHLVVCLTRPRIAYNEDVLTEDKGECVICFEEMSQGDTIARLPCLCVYHKTCIDSWFKVKNSCPEHPGDD